MHEELREAEEARPRQQDAEQAQIQERMEATIKHILEQDNQLRMEMIQLEGRVANEEQHSARNKDKVEQAQAHKREEQRKGTAPGHAATTLY